MYDYRTPRKKRGQVQVRRSSHVGRVTSTKRTTPVNPKRVVVSRTPNQTAGGIGSVLTGLGFLAIMIGSIYVLLLQVVLPSFFQVAKDQVLVVSAIEKPEAGDAVSVVRLSPIQKKLVIVNGTLPTMPLEVQLPLSWQLGIPIDHVLVFDQTQVLTKTDLVRQLRKLVTEGKGTTKPVALRDRVSWWLFARSVPRANVRLIEVEQASEWGTARRLLTDGRASATCPVAVLNTISKTGAASQMSQLLEQAGLIVIRVGDTPDKKDITEIVLDETAQNCVAEAEWIGQLVGMDEAGSVAVTTAPGVLSQYRAPIVLKIGQDLVPALDGKAALAQ